MDAQFGGSVAERNVRSGAWMHSLEEVCRKGRPGVGAWMQSSCGKLIREERNQFHLRMRIIISPEKR